MESALTSNGRIRCTSANLRMAYVMRRIPVAKARLRRQFSAFAAMRSIAFTVSSVMDGACVGSSLDSTTSADNTNGFVSGQSIRNASGHTASACLPAEGAVRPRSATDSR